FVISFQEDPDDTFIPVRRRAHEGLGKIRKKGADYLTYTLVDTVVDGYYTVLDSLETQVLELEESLYLGGINPVSKSKMFRLKRTINEFKHRVMPMREAVTRFYRSESDLIDESNRLYFR